MRRIRSDGGSPDELPDAAEDARAVLRQRVGQLAHAEVRIPEALLDRFAHACHVRPIVRREPGIDRRASWRADS